MKLPRKGHKYICNKPSLTETETSKEEKMATIRTEFKLLYSGRYKKNIYIWNLYMLRLSIIKKLKALKTFHLKVLTIVNQ